MQSTTSASRVPFLAFLAVLLQLSSDAAAIEVAITSPPDGATVSGVVTITGTSVDVGAGVASVSIDGGPSFTDLFLTCADPASPIFATDKVRSLVDQWSWLEQGGVPFCLDMALQSEPPYECRSTLEVEADTEYAQVRVSVAIGINDSFNPWMDPAAMDYWQKISAASKTFDRPDAPHLVVASQAGANVVYQRITEIVNAASGPAIPTASAWGMIVMTLLLLTAGTITMAQRASHRNNDGRLRPSRADSLFVSLLGMVLLVCPSTSLAEPIAAQQSSTIKWFPGHYVQWGAQAPNGNWGAIMDDPNFQGGLRVYTWRELEPQEGQYDFSLIAQNLSDLEDGGKRLVVELWDTWFWDDGVLAVPDYLLTDPIYQGGIVQRNGPGHIAKRYVPAVMDRWIAVWQALGVAFDQEPAVAGAVITETAFSLGGAGSEDYSDEDYHTQMKRLVEAVAGAFSFTPVTIYGNWYPPGQGLLVDLAATALPVRVGWGGPDLKPGAGIWGYDIIRDNQGVMALGVAAQWDSYSGEWSADELINFAVDDLQLNFVYWLNADRSATGGLSLIVDVIPAVDAAGGRINADVPSIYDTNVPAVSKWGLIVIMLSLLTAASIVLSRRCRGMEGFEEC